MHDPKEIVLLKLCSPFNGVDTSINMILLKACISVGSESVGSRLTCGVEVLGSQKYTMRKQPFSSFA